MTESSQSHQFTSLLENKFAGVILWDKNKILTHMNNNVEQLRSFQIGNCWYEIFEDILISEKNIKLTGSLIRSIIILAQMNEHIW